MFYFFFWMFVLYNPFYKTNPFFYSSCYYFVVELWMLIIYLIVFVYFCFIFFLLFIIVMKGICNREEWVNDDYRLNKVCQDWRYRLFFGIHENYTDEEIPIQPFSVRELMPDTKHYMTYEGSITMPACHETTSWIILNKPIYITKQQVKIFIFIFVIYL